MNITPKQPYRTLATDLAARDPNPRSPELGARPGRQVVLLAQAGASADGVAAVLRAQGVDDRMLTRQMTLTVVDQLGMTGHLYHPDDVARARRASRTIPPAFNIDVAGTAGSQDTRRRDLIDKWCTPAPAAAPPGPSPAIEPPAPGA